VSAGRAGIPIVIDPRQSVIAIRSATAGLESGSGYTTKITDRFSYENQHPNAKHKSGIDFAIENGDPFLCGNRDPNAKYKSRIDWKMKNRDRFL
jgi:hypothetical protein